MPVFRAHARRRPVTRPRRGRSARWAPPGRSASATTTIDLRTFADPFRRTTLEPWWVDTAVVAPGTGYDPVVTAGAGMVFTPAVGQSSEVNGRYTFDLAGDSVTFKISIPANTFTVTSSIIGISLEASSSTPVQFDLRHTGTVWEVTIYLDNAAVTNTYTTTTGAEWRYLRMSSDPVTPLAVTVYRSPDGNIWTAVGTRTFASLALISSLKFYAWGTGA